MEVKSTGFPIESGMTKLRHSSLVINHLSLTISIPQAYAPCDASNGIFERRFFNDYGVVTIAVLEYAEFPTTLNARTRYE